ncbi:MAG: hypothetical protein IJS39_11405 [Synergistaceae bacterium]|nr:hypothetical protein [Synergistaceae bacterium]
MKKLLLLAIAVSVCVYPNCSFAESIIVKRGTEVLVKVIERIKSNQVSEGQTVQFLVERAVKDNKGFVLIEQGAFAYGTITKASSAGMFGTKGKLGISIDSAEAYNGVIVPLSANKDSEGSSSTGAVVAGMLLVSPLAIFFRGSNAVLEAGTILRAYVQKDTVLYEDASDKQDVPDKLEGQNETDRRFYELFREYERPAE